MSDGSIPDVGRRKQQRALTTGRGLIAACHIQPTLAVTAFTTVLAAASGSRRKSLAVGAAVLSGQLAVGWSNDYWDRFIDARAGRLDKPIVAGHVSADLVRTSALAAGAACVPLSLLSGRRAGLVHLAAVGAGLAYNARLKHTRLSVAPYLVAFGALPAFVGLSAEQRRLPPAHTMVAAALLGAGAHFINVLADVEADEITGVRGLPQRLGPVRALPVGAALLTASNLVIAGFGPRPMSSLQRMLIATSAAAVAAVIGAARTGRPRFAWSMSLTAAASTVTLYVTQTYARNTPTRRS